MNDNMKIKYFDEELEVYDERRVVNKNTYSITLNYVPSPKRPLTVENGKTMLTETTDTPNANQYVLDRENGLLLFNKAMKGKVMTINYSAIGLWCISADKVYTNVDNKGEIIETLEDLMRENRQAIESIKTVGDASTVITQLQANIDSVTGLVGNIAEGSSVNEELTKSITSGKGTNTTLTNTISNANNKINEMNTWVNQHGDIVNLDNRVDTVEVEIPKINEQLDKNTNNITRISENLTTPFNFKGNCLFSELPQTANVNDTWYLTDKKYRVSWNGDNWEQSSLDESDYTDELGSVRDSVGEYTSIRNNLFQRQNLIQYGVATIGGISNTYIITPNDYGGIIVDSQIFNLNYEKIYISFICKNTSDLVIQLLNSGNGYLVNLTTIEKSEGYQFINLSFTKSEIEAITSSNIIKLAFGSYSEFTLMYPIVSTVNNLENNISNDISKIYDIFTKNNTRISKVMGDAGIDYSLSVFGDTTKISFEQANDIISINSSDYGGVKLNNTINVNYIDNLYISGYVEADSYVDVSFLNANLGFISGVRVQVPKNSNLINLSFSKSELIAKGVTSTFIIGFASYSKIWSISNLVVSSKNNFQGTLTKELNKINNSLVKLFEYETPKPYQGMRILSLGDSFTFLNYYGKYLAKETGCTQRGRGQNGGELSTFCRGSYTGSDGQPKEELFDANLLNQYDIITVMGGTNDFANAKTPLGTIDDSKDMQTIYGSVKKIIDTIKTIKPSISIIFCTQPHRFGYSHGIQTINGYERNSQGVTMTDINNAIIETCSRYGVPCFDYASISDWNEYTIIDFENCKYTYDGLHPKDGDGNGADILGTSFGRFINGLKLF